MLSRSKATEAEREFQDALTAYRRAAPDAPTKPPEQRTKEDGELRPAKVNAETRLSQANAHRAAAREEQIHWEQMGPVNDELAAARSGMAQAQREMSAQLNSGRGWEGPVYDRWSAATQRLQNAERAFGNATFGRS